MLPICLAVALAAQPDTPQPDTGRLEIEADVMEGSPATGLVVGRGNVRVTDRGLLLQADELRYETEGETVTVQGNVVLTRESARVLADELVYHRGDRSFTASHVRLGSHMVHAEGESAAGTPDEIVVSGARVFYGEPGRWQPTLTADSLTLLPGRRLRSENAQAGIGQSQFIPFPRFQQNLANPYLGQVALSGGFRSSLGAFAIAGVHLPLGASVRLGGELGIYTSRGVMAGPAGRYAHAADPDRMRGHFRSGYIRDHGDRKTDLLGRPVPPDRAFAEWQHSQLLTDNLTLTAQVNWWRDSEVLRDFRPDAFFPVQEPDTFVESVYRGPNYFLSAFARLQPNRFHTVQERLPEIRFDLLPFALGNGFLHHAQASAAVLQEDPPGGGPRLRSDRLDGYYAIERPFTTREWFTFTPIVGGRVTHYANTEGAMRTGNYTRLLGEFGVDAVLRSSATFDYRNPRWKIDGLRHLLTPRLSYRYIPEAEKGRARIPRIDRQSFSTYLPPLGLGEIRHLDDLHATNTLRFSVDNVLQTRDAEDGSRDLVALNLANDFRFQRQPGERDVSELHAGLSLAPVPWLQVDVYQSLTPRSMGFREFNAAVTIRDGRVWSLRFANNFLRNEIEDYWIDGRYRFNEVYEAVTRLQYDSRRRRFNE
ncbi:MAG: LPS assembly protein LptD, partial [Opitutus sp.]